MPSIRGPGIGGKLGLSEAVLTKPARPLPYKTSDNMQRKSDYATMSTYISGSTININARTPMRPITRDLPHSVAANLANAVKATEEQPYSEPSN